MSSARLLPLRPAAPDDPRGAVGERLRALAADFAAAAARLGSRDDREAVHDLRVSCRRLAAALELWQHVLEPRPARRARRRLRKLRRRLSQTREREVLAEQLGELLIGEPLAAREAGLRYRRRLDRQVARGRARAASRSSRARIERTREAIESAIRFTPELPPTWRATARDGVETESTAARAALREALALGEDPLLHESRIAVKRWRYAIEALHAAGLSDEHVEGLRTLRDLQRCLGEIHDAALLRDLLARRARRAPTGAPPKRIAALERLSRKADEARRRAWERLPALAAAAGAPPAP